MNFKKISKKFKEIKGNYYTIQIVPENSSHVRTLRISHIYIKLMIWFLIVILIFSGIIMWKFTEINAVMLTSKYLKNTNEQLEERHLEYEMAFAELDSIYSMERQIQNILQTYYSNDSGVISSILDSNRFNRISAIKTKFDKDRIYDYSMYNNQNLNSYPNILPVIGTITKRFELNGSHKGMDFSGKEGTQIRSTSAGTIKKCVFIDKLTKAEAMIDSITSAGNTIVIEHKYNDTVFTTVYSHLKDILVKEGKYVSKGEIIGTMGNTGNSNKAHLHYEIKVNGKHVNPEKYFNH